MKYVLEGVEEAARLEEQNTQINYDFSYELNDLTFHSDDYVLEAGCGSGLVGRTLLKKYPDLQIDGFDFSSVRVQQAVKLATDEDLKINFFQSDIYSLGIKNKYDKIICRYVFQHLLEPKKAMTELFNALKPGGTIYLIDIDGILFNLGSANEELNKHLSKLRLFYPFDFYIARKLPSLCKSCNFENISWSNKLMLFDGVEFDKEKQNYRHRLDAAADKLSDLLGGTDEFQAFRDLYLSELIPENPLYYMKFIVKAKKPI